MSKEQLRNELARLTQYVNVASLVSDLGISKSNYYSFMSGDDRRLSVKACEKIINALNKIPISVK